MACAAPGVFERDAALTNGVSITKLKIHHLSGCIAPHRHHKFMLKISGNFAHKK